MRRRLPTERRSRRRLPPASGRYRSWEADHRPRGTWPVRQLERLPRFVLVGAVTLMSAWVVAWLVLLVAGFNFLSSY